MNTQENSGNNGKQLMSDMKAVIKDAEVLIKNSGLPSGDDFRSAKERFEATLKNAKDEMMRIEKLVVDKTKVAAATTDNYVKDNPWQAVGLGAAIGLAIGLLLGRK